MATLLKNSFETSLSGKKSVTLRAVVDEASFETRLYPSDATFVDVGFLLLLRGYLDVEIVNSLSINQCYAQLLFLSCVDEHSLHEALLSSSKRTARSRKADAGAGAKDRSGIDRHPIVTGADSRLGHALFLILNIGPIRTLVGRPRSRVAGLASTFARPSDGPARWAVGRRA